MINQLRQEMKNKMQVKAKINLVSDINLKCKLWLNFYSENEVKMWLEITSMIQIKLVTMGHHTSGLFDMFTHSVKV